MPSPVLPLIGSIVVAGENYDMVTNILAFIAVTCSTINVVGGFLITDRILKMFKKENKPRVNNIMSILQLCYVISAILFILGIRSLSSPETARRGMNLASLGMFIAVVGTLFSHQIVSYTWIIAGIVLGTVLSIAYFSLDTHDKNSATNCAFACRWCSGCMSYWYC